MPKPPILLRIITRIMRVFFYLLYHQLAWAYDFIADIVSMGFWKEWINRVIPFLEGPQLLELGHGPGHLQAQLSLMGCNHFGIDESSHMGRIAAKHLRKYPGTHRLIQCRAQNLPFKDETFNQAAATFPSEYILDPDTICETFRVLIPGGKLVFLPAASITGKRWFERAASWLLRTSGYDTFWTMDYLTQFRDAGFEMESIKVEETAWSLIIVVGKKPE